MTNSTAGHGRWRLVKSVARTLETLEFFDEFRRPANVVDVARKLGYPQSSAAALLKSMVAMGYLEYDHKKRTYFPTDRVPLIGSWMNPLLYGDGALIRLLNSLAARTGLIVLLAFKNGDDAQYIQVLNNDGTLDPYIVLGARRPLILSGVGFTLLSEMTNEQVRKMFHRINAYRKEKEAHIDIVALLKCLEQVRKRGYSVSAEPSGGGAGVISMLLPEGCTERPLCLGVAGASKQIRDGEKELVVTMREEIARYLGQHIAVIHNSTDFRRVPRAKNGKILAAGMQRYAKESLAG